MKNHPDDSLEEDESRERTHLLLRGECFGLVIPNEDADHEFAKAAKAVFAAFMPAEPRRQVKTETWDIGRSASVAEIVVYVSAGVVALTGGIKSLDEAAQILRKWWKALKKMRRKYRQGYFTREALKLACIDDLIDRFGKENLPRYDLMTSSTAVGRFDDGTWTPVYPHYFLIPDPTRKITFLYVVDAVGSILHRSDLPYFMDEYFEDSRGAISDSPWVDEQRLMMNLVKDHRTKARAQAARRRKAMRRR
jgi:hypothetical protein